METEHTSIWLRPERGSRGRAPEHTRDGIAAVAVRLADSDGLAAVTMRSVAEALGGGSASLYRYVESRDELVALMVDQVNGEIDYTVLDHTDWLADLLALGRQSRDVYLRHPWLTDTPAATGDLGPNAVAYLEHALARDARPRRRRPPQARGRRRLQRRRPAPGPHRDRAARHRPARPAPPARGRRPPRASQGGAHPHLAAALSAPPVEPDEDQTERLLTRVLRGLLGA